METDLTPWPTRPTHFQKTPQNKEEALGAAGGDTAISGATEAKRVARVGQHPQTPVAASDLLAQPRVGHGWAGRATGGPAPLDLALLLRRLQQLDRKANQLLNAINRTPQP